MNPSILASLLALAIASALSVDARAQSPSPQSVDAQVMNSDSFLSAHPDLRFRLLGLKAYKAGNMRKALEHFKRAARYADKPSQAMVGELLWAGRGVATDRAQAHAWMDVSAERDYPIMVKQRDRYWQALSADEQARARALAPALFGEYGDQVAQPRLEAVMRRERNNTTGSRTGFTGSLRIIIPGPAGDITLDGSQFYQDKFWKAKDYWSWQGEDWKELPKARVDVGPLRANDAP